MHTIKTALIGLGHVGRNFLKILTMKEARLADQYGVGFRVVCVADSSGVAVDPAGFDPSTTMQHKLDGKRAADLPGFRPGLSPAQAVTELAPKLDMVLDASPVNLQTGEPGLGVARAALSQGISVVLANKAPLVLAFDELHDLAARTGAGLAFSATVCGALPVINIGRRDLIAADVHSLRGIFNSTSNFILGEMARGRSYGEALAEAQERGIAEADPSLDVEGWDTANKLVIIANSFLVNAGEGSGSGSGNGSVGLADVQVQGITELGSADLQVQLAQGRTIKLVASAQRRADGGYDLSVAPTVLEQDEFLGRCDGWEMGIEIHSDLYGRMYHKIWEREPLPTAAAMLRDAVDIVNRVSSIE